MLILLILSFLRKILLGIIFSHIRRKVEVAINLKVVGMLGVGESFGEVALLHDIPRTATVITIKETSLWGQDRVTFRTILQTISVAKYSEYLGFVEVTPIFKNLTKKQNESQANGTMTETFKSRDRI